MEWHVLALMNACHRKRGLYIGSEKSGKTGLWLRFKFDDNVWFQRFRRWVEMGEFVKGIKLGEKDSNEIAVLLAN